MLFRNTVSEYALELLKRINYHKAFDDFFLVGGTSLALQIGHRISVDLDFFSSQSFDENKLAEILIKDFNASITNLNNNTVSGTIDTVKFDFISHQYKLLQPVNEIEEIRFSSVDDIAAMKINAINNRGTKKDFVDMFFLIQSKPLSQILDLASKKYPNYNRFLALKSLIYFEDANNQPDCNILSDTSWEEIKSSIRKAVTEI